MTGRGIDQILPNAGNPLLHESYVHDARRYVRLAEARSGTLTKPVPFDYIWGDALKLLAEYAPQARLINLETAVTPSEDYWPGKEVHYRMHPANIQCITTAGIDCCTLANNHVLDWGYTGLVDTLNTLHDTGLLTAGAGDSLEQACSPAVLPLDNNRRLLIYAVGSPTSGVPPEWAATPEWPGVALLDDMTERSVEMIRQWVISRKRTGDIAVLSVHWGGNWGYKIPAEQQRLAHRLIDHAGIDLVWGHSSHHPKGIEVYNDRLVLYGCGDFLNDYEGIGGYEGFRPELTLMYFPELTEDGRLRELTMIPLRIHRLQLQQPKADDCAWLHRTLQEQGARLTTTVTLAGDRLHLDW